VEQDARRLRRVAIIRLSKSFLKEIPPFSEFPPGLTNIINGYYCHVSGGLAIDGSLEAPVVEEEVIRECQKIRELNLTAVVIAGVFSPIDEVFKQEDYVRRIVLQELPGVDVVCSHEVANIGFMERENAAILNASILKYARRTVGGFKSAMNRLNLKCGLFLTQNDGTLVDSAAAAKLPIRTFSSGATNSMRGAAYLSGIKGGSTSTLVIDIGGTTSDVGVLLPSGFPRQANAYVTVAGVSVNYSMPHLESIGLGGGSIVRATSSDVTVGPDSVGHYLTSESLVFSGKTMTATDISVGARKANIGDPSLVENLDKNIMNAAQARIKILLERAIDVMKTSPEPLPVLLVGGGSIIAPEKLEGASSLIRPPFHDVANAVGAAVGKVGGIVDIVQGTSSQTVVEATERAKKMATERAVASGAIESSVTIAEVEAMPLQYVTNQVRTIVKAVGELDLGFNHAFMDNANGEEIFEPEEAKRSAAKAFAGPSVNPMTYHPEVIVSKESGHPEWFISETDLNWLADGCYVLGKEAAYT
jgi:N-methylhydantoinase A/oxoprolinase/acetone carboxylase beta subunit